MINRLIVSIDHIFNLIEPILLIYQANHCRMAKNGYTPPIVKHTRTPW